jgi:hypothetical protein
MTSQHTDRVNFITTEIKDDVQHNQQHDLSLVVQGLDPKGDEFKAIQAALGAHGSNDGLPPLALTFDGQNTKLMEGNNAVVTDQYKGKELIVTGGQVTNVDSNGVIHTRDINNETRTFDPTTSKETTVVSDKNSGGNTLSEIVRNGPGERPSQITYFPGTSNEQTVSFNADGYAIPGHGLPAEARVDPAGVIKWDAQGNSFTQNPDGTRSSVPYGRGGDPDAVTTHYGPDHEPKGYSNNGKNFEMHVEADGSKTWWFTEDSKPGQYIPEVAPFSQAKKLVR